MARRNLVRSLLAASLLALSGAAVFVAPAPQAGAVDNNYVDVTLAATGFIPATVYARPGDLVRFTLDTGVSTNHTVTLEAGRCASLPNQLCEKNFDDPGNPPVFRFSTADTYPYFDRIARDAGNNNMRGTIIVTDHPPVTTSTNPPPVDESSTTTTAPPVTTTTTSGSVHSLVVTNSEPQATTTTTTPPHLTVINTGPPPGKAASAGASAAADAAKGKGKAAATTTTTAPPAVPDASVLDPAALIPAPEATPAPPSDAVTSVDDVTSSAAADLLHNDRGADDGTRLLLIALAALGVFLLGGGIFGWYHRSSRYFPA